MIKNQLSKKVQIKNELEEKQFILNTVRNVKYGT